MKNTKKIKDTNIIVRVSIHDFYEIKRCAHEAGYTVSEYIRRLALHSNLPSKTDAQAVFQIKKIGNNLNQLARHLNMNASEESIKYALSRFDEYYYPEFDKIIERLK